MIIKALLCSFFIFYAHAMGLNLITYKIPQYIQSTSEGEFIELVNILAKENNYVVELSTYPPARAIQNFSKENYHGYFPGLDVLNTNIDIVNTIPFYFKKDYLFYKKDHKIDLNQNKTICLTNGYPYTADILSKDNLTFIYASSDEACLKMLSLKRVDGFICEAITGIIAKESTGLTDIKIAPQPISTQEVYFTFKNNSKGRILAKQFSKTIKELRKNGKLKKIFQKASERVRAYIKVYNPTQR